VAFIQCCLYRQGKFGERERGRKGRREIDERERDRDREREREKLYVISTSQGMPNIPSKPLEVGRKAWNSFSSQLSEGTNPVDTMILELAPELRNNKFLLFKPSSL
jgi:hypothetical protein